MKTSCKYVIVYDIETGGLPSSTNPAFTKIALVEIAMVVVDITTLSIINEYSAIIKPDYTEDLIYTKEAEVVHGISKEIMKANGIDIKTVYKDVTTLFKKYKNPRHKCTLAGHNIVGFDNEFIKNMCSFMGENMEDYVKFSEDTMQWAYLCKEEQPDYKLHTCCEGMGVELVNHHRALDDTKATAQLFIEFIKRLRGEGAVIQKEVRNRENFQL